MTGKRQRPVHHEGDRLIQIILDEEEDRDGKTIGLLLEQFWNGYDVSKLNVLLSHPKNAVAVLGAHVLSELGPVGRPLFGRTISLLSHPYAPVRGLAVDSILAWSDLADGQAVALILGLIVDPDASVRRKVTNFISRIGIRLLEAATNFLPDIESTKSHLKGIGLMTEAGVSSIDTLVAAVTAPDEIVQKYSVACALRFRHAATIILKKACRSGDEAIVTLARSYLK